MMSSKALKGTSTAREGTMTRQTKIAYVQAAWHTDITDRCKQAFVAELARHGYDQSGIEFFSAPGSLEIPLMAKKLAKTGRYAAVCASGFVVDGGIYRHELRRPGGAPGHRADLAGHRGPRPLRGPHAPSLPRSRRPRGVLQGPHADQGRGARRSLPVDDRDAEHPQRFLRRTSSSGADHGYGSMSISAGSSTRGPMPLGQMYWKIGAIRTRS